MKEMIGDLFKQDCDAICITTNGILKNDGRAVMGAGVAKAARDKFPGIDQVLGLMLKKNGNITQVLLPLNKPAIVSLPTKNHWRDASDINLIEASVKQLVQIADQRSWNRVCLTRPGCGNGGLEWPTVKARIEKLLDDRFVILTPS